MRHKLTARPLVCLLHWALARLFLSRTKLAPIPNVGIKQVLSVRPSHTVNVHCAAPQIWSPDPAQLPVPTPNAASMLHGHLPTVQLADFAWLYPHGSCPVPHIPAPAQVSDYVLSATSPSHQSTLSASVEPRTVLPEPLTSSAMPTAETLPPKYACSFEPPETGTSSPGTTSQLDQTGAPCHSHMINHTETFIFKTMCYDPSSTDGR